MPWILNCLHLVPISERHVWLLDSSFTAIGGPVSHPPTGRACDDPPGFDGVVVNLSFNSRAISAARSTDFYFLGKAATFCMEQ